MPSVRQTLEDPKKPSAGVAGLQHGTEKQPFSRGPCLRGVVRSDRAR